MRTPICDQLGIEFPIFAFSHCRDVVAAVSRAGGFGVLGAAGHTPESLEIELKWIDDHIDGKPYGPVELPRELPAGRWLELAPERVLVERYVPGRELTSFGDGGRQPDEAAQELENVAAATHGELRSLGPMAENDCRKTKVEQ